LSPSTELPILLIPRDCVPGRIGAGEAHYSPPYRGLELVEFYFTPPILHHDETRRRGTWYRWDSSFSLDWFLRVQLPLFTERSQLLHASTLHTVDHDYLDKILRGDTCVYIFNALLSPLFCMLNVAHVLIYCRRKCKNNVS
jgi:hypothetical protein